MKMTDENIRRRVKGLILVCFLAASVADHAMAQYLTATNWADLSQQAFDGSHSIYLPSTPWQWQAYSLDGGLPFWVDCSQFPCAEFFQVSTNLQSYGIQLASVVLTKNVLTGEVTVQPNGSTDIV